MIKRLFIFSDMQFNAATREHETNFDCAKNKFNEAGYQLPQVVFWNLAGFETCTVPSIKTESNVAMISGFSGQLMKLFMENGDIDPILVLSKAVEPYDYLRVMD